jgi:dihydropteroate synthase
MGILNVTPDSFSDGGRHLDPQTAVDAALKMEADGADIIDVGGESTRPYSRVVPVAEELQRVIPVLEKLRTLVKVPISIDTSKAEVAAAAIDAGAEIINDVTGLEGDPEMAGLAVERGVGVCVMHMRGTPQTMQDDPQYEDVVAEIHDYLVARLQFCLDRQIPQQRVCLDPGIGFGKTHEHNVTLVREVHRFLDIGCPLLVGHSRKGFIGHLLGDKQADRMAATLGVSLALAASGVDVLRVHDVRETSEAIKLFKACGGLDR